MYVGHSRVIRKIVWHKSIAGQDIYSINTRVLAFHRDDVMIHVFQTSCRPRSEESSRRGTKQEQSSCQTKRNTNARLSQPVLLDY